MLSRSPIRVNPMSAFGGPGWRAVVFTEPLTRLPARLDLNVPRHGAGRRSAGSRGHGAGIFVASHVRDEAAERRA
jgi:hypothetical protein